MNKFLILTILAVFIIPLSSVIPLAGQPLWYGQYLGFLFCLFLGISIFLWDFDKPLSILTAYCLYSAFFITNLNPRSIILLIQLDLGCLTSYLISKFNTKQRKYILWSILCFTILQFLWVALQKFNLDPFFDKLGNPKLDDMVGFAGSKNQLGSFFALTMPVLLNFSPYLLAISMLGLIVAKSSFAFIAALASAVIYYKFTDIKKFRFVSLILLTLTICFLLARDIPKFTDFRTRIGVWNYAVKSTVSGEIFIEKGNQKLIVHTNPVFGYGFGNFLSIFPYVPQKVSQRYFGTNCQFNYDTEKFTHAHNDFVEYFFELGWAGLGIIFLMLLNFFYQFIKSKKSQEIVLYFACLLAYLINSCGNFLSQIAVSGMFLILYYGMFKGAIRDGQTSVSC